MRRIWAALACTACLLGLLATGSFASAEEAPAPLPEAAPAVSGSCVANFVCIWNQINYEGAIEYYECSKVGSYGTPYGNPYRSAMNRCGNKAVELLGPDPACMEPGGERPSPGYFTGLSFRGYGEHC
jgi:hypothetical protein